MTTQATPIAEELKITIEGAEYLASLNADSEHPDPIDDALDMLHDAAQLVGPVAEAVRVMLDALETIAAGNTDPDRMVEIAREAIAKTEGAQ